jgi:hypothetical protein
MLRTRGVPARVVGGFFGGERVGEKFVVRAGDAHAWVEAYSPSKGWLTFDATPESGRGSRPPALMSRLVDAYERLEEAWRAQVVDYSISDQWEFVRQLIRPPANASSGSDEPEEKKGPITRTPARAIFAAIGAGVLAFLVWRRLTRFSSKDHPASGFLADLDERLEALKVARRSDEDLEALSHRLRVERHRLAEPLGKATRRYLEARFGKRPLTREERKSLLAALDHSGDAGR